MNTGIQDAFNLAWKLALVVHGKAADALLDTYPQERLPIAESVMKLSDRMITMATLHHPIPKHLRNHLAPFLANHEFIQKRMRNAISEVSVQYRRSPIVQEHRTGLMQSLHSHKLHAGDRVPDVSPLIGPDGRECRLFELLRGTRHALLIIPASPDDVRKLPLADLGRWMDELDIYIVAKEVGWVRESDASTASSQAKGIEVQTIIDPEQNLLDRLDSDPGSLILIRPDGYVGYYANSIDLTPLHSYFRQLYM